MQICQLSTKPYVTFLKNNDSISNSKMKSNNKVYENIITATPIVGLAGILALLAGRKSIKTMEQAMNAKGIKMQDACAILKESGEKFTGKIVRNTRPFGLVKETTIFNNGVISEILYHNKFGKEIKGTFYQNGKEKFIVSVNAYPSDKSARYSLSEIAQNGQVVSLMDCKKQGKGSVFDIIRNKI